MRFSQRIGKSKFRKTIQLKSIDESLYNKLWNLIVNTFFVRLNSMSDNDIRGFCQYVWTDFFGERVDETPPYTVMFGKDFGTELKERFFEGMRWYEIYDFLEFMSDLDSRHFEINFQEKCNDALKEELSGYRLIDL